ncbi:MAG TPA: CAP family protein [Candidatus Tectomicrobia bacterium]
MAGWSASTSTPYIPWRRRSNKALRPFSGGVCGWVFCAKNWQLARTNRLVHSHHSQVGENLAMFRSSHHEPPPPAAVVERWYRKINDYTFTQPGFQAHTGHFTQVVWKASHALGIGMAQAGDGTWYIVGHYSPPGNITGHFPANVLPPTP